MVWQRVIWFLQGSLDRDERGSSVVEYALLLALLAVVCLLALDYLGGQTAGGYSEAATSIAAS